MLLWLPRFITWSWRYNPSSPHMVFSLRSYRYERFIHLTTTYISYLTKMVFEAYKDKLNTNTDYQKIDTYIWQGIAMLPLIERKVIISKYYPNFYGVEYLTDRAIGRILRIFKGKTSEILQRAVWKVNKHIDECVNRGEL